MGSMCLTKNGWSRLTLKVPSLSQRARLFHSHPIAAAKQLPPRTKLNEEDVREAFVHGTGPGGQKINKTACAVQLKHLPTGIVTKCQETRSRSQNRKTAWRILAEKIEEKEKGPESRTAIKAQVKSRKKASKTKKARRKYKTFQQDHEQAGSEEGGDEESKEDKATETEKEDMKEQRVG